MIKSDPLTGLIPATFTPFTEQGQVDEKGIVRLCSHLVDQPISSVYINGSTGEGVSLTTQERLRVAEIFVGELNGQLPVVVQVGHNSLEESIGLAKHAEKIGACAISATPPNYFAPSDLTSLVASISRIAGAVPEMPFYYYHIPQRTGVHFRISEILTACVDIPNVRGAKFSQPALHQLQTAAKLNEGAYDLLFGVDEMLLSAWSVGVRGAVGTTYNFAAPLYKKMIDHFDKGELLQARALQEKSVEMVNTVIKMLGWSGFKAVMKMIGVDCGPSRLPLPRLAKEDIAAAEAELSRIGFFD